MWGNWKHDIRWWGSNLLRWIWVSSLIPHCAEMLPVIEVFFHRYLLLFFKSSLESKRNQNKMGLEQTPVLMMRCLHVRCRISTTFHSVWRNESLDVFIWPDDKTVVFRFRTQTKKNEWLNREKERNNFDKRKQNRSYKFKKSKTGLLKSATLTWILNSTQFFFWFNRYVIFFQSFQSIAEWR